MRAPLALPRRDPQARLDPRVKRTRRLLQNAFAELLAAKDFDDITVQDITDRAEVNRATFYAHFEDKFALLDYHVQERLNYALRQRLPDAERFTLPNLRALTVIVYEFIVESVGQCPPATHREIQMRVGAQTQRSLYALLVAWLAGGEELPEDETLCSRAAAVSWMIFGAAFQAVMTRQRQSPAELADQMVEFLRPSLTPYLDPPARLR